MDTKTLFNLDGLVVKVTTGLVRPLDKMVTINVDHENVFSVITRGDNSAVIVMNWNRKLRLTTHNGSPAFEVE
ncbi:MAG: hypothetical protein RL536_366 [Candidatus Parcubacteria bacterium]